MFIVESLLEKNRIDLFDIKIKENDDEDININNLSDILKEIRKAFSVVGKLNDLYKLHPMTGDQTELFLSSVNLFLNSVF